MLLQKHTKNHVLGTIEGKTWVHKIIFVWIFKGLWRAKLIDSFFGPSRIEGSSHPVGLLRRIVWTWV